MSAEAESERDADYTADIQLSSRAATCHVKRLVKSEVISDDRSHRGHNFDFQAIHHLKKIGRSSKDS